MSLDAMKQALDAFEEINKLSVGENAICLPAEIDGAMDALRAAIEQAQEPVAWMHPSWIDPDTRGWESDSFNAIPIEGWVPVFTAPRQWQGLTDEQFETMAEKYVTNCYFDTLKFARAIEAKLKEKNS
jgi:hypothetical protein